MGFVYPIGGKTYGNEQNKVTKNGTLKSTTNPWKIETTTKLSPLSLPQEKYTFQHRIHFYIAEAL